MRFQLSSHAVRIILPSRRGSAIFSPAKLVVPAYITAIAVAEALVALFGGVSGLLCHAILVPMLLSHYVLADRMPYRRILPALALAPLLRIVSLSLPLEGVPQIYWYALVGAPLLVAIALTARFLGLSMDQLGLRARSWLLQIAIAFSGFPLSIAALLMFPPAPVMTRFDWPDALIGAVILIVFTGFTEEILFRGIVQHIAIAIFGRTGMLYGSILFAIMYFGSLSAGYVLFIGLAGLFFSWCVDRTGSIWGVALAHGILNVMLLLVMPYMIAHPPDALSTLLFWSIWSGMIFSLIVLLLLLRANVAARAARAEVMAPQILRARRRACGLSYVELAQRTGLRVRLLAEIEHGLRLIEPEQLKLIAGALGVEPGMVASAGADQRRPETRGFTLVPPLPNEAAGLDIAQQHASSFI